MHLCEILANFAMPTYQIWSCHVTQVGNLESFLYLPDSAFNFRKIHSGKFFTSGVTSQKPHGGGTEHPQSDFYAYENFMLRF